MNKKRARQILTERNAIHVDGTLLNVGWYVNWPSAAEVTEAVLDGQFTADELEAIAWWMRHAKVKAKPEGVL